MLRNLRIRRRPRYGVRVCAVISALLLLLSVSLLYSSLSHSQSHPYRNHLYTRSQNDLDSTPILSDSQHEGVSTSEDKLDELDIVEEEQQQHDEAEDEDDNDQSDRHRASGYFFDYLSGAIRRAIGKRSIDQWDDDWLGVMIGSSVDDRSKAAFGSDDVPVDEMVRRKVAEVVSIEDALLVKLTGRGRASPLREGWGDWFDKKSDFLRRDKMFKSNVEALNRLNNPMLQDPDGVGVTTLTRGDRLAQKWWLNQFRRVPFLAKKPLSVSELNSKLKPKENHIGFAVASKESDSSFNGSGGELRLRTEAKRAERRTLYENVNVDNGLNGRTIINTEDEVLNLSDRIDSKRTEHSTSVQDIGNGLTSYKIIGSSNRDLSSFKKIDSLNGELGQTGGGLDDVDDVVGGQAEFSGHIYADGKRWGYYPGLHPRLSFSDFIDAFFRKEKCDVRVFMVWNSPPWMYGVRHQRGLESLLSWHRDACVVVFSETIELDFFKYSLVNDGYKVAVAMPNLDELLKDTPTHVFASVWFEWRKTKFYSTHYSELARLAALYKYGGIYLDSDIIILKPLSGLNNTVGMEDHLSGSSLNGAVMAFRKHSSFVMECLKEFYMTYDDTLLRWNGADLLTRVARKFLSLENTSTRQLELNVQASFTFFPISSQHITRYFSTPATEAEKAKQDALFRKILKELLTFHFWNSLTSALIPETDSLVSRLIDHHCIHCFDVL
ncbi:hypothetical protein I3843_09G076500 [Carya illinoinensis]|uniref:Alpha 1,4-glycosyltransferase domain-containing protein n=1 Tax=Carya illinoinensis TaxID=32201 RepID=A0A922J576_CARIL|nr:hypothetical protein I3842_09G076700 [Carya illinoinensis]KAG7962668.1 hypothetical protein I3843_09G076500 [Carya illinoinensis]